MTGDSGATVAVGPSARAPAQARFPKVFLVRPLSIAARCWLVIDLSSAEVRKLVKN
jgi:hypothetical protein